MSDITADELAKHEEWNRQQRQANNAGTNTIPKPVPGAGYGFIEDRGTAFMWGMFGERGVRSLELIADALQTLARGESERLSREYPPDRTPHAAQINRASDEQREQFKDKADDQWLRETEAALPKSRFETRLEAQKASGAGEAAKK